MKLATNPPARTRLLRGAVIDGDQHDRTGWSAGSLQQKSQVGQRPFYPIQDRRFSAQVSISEESALEGSETTSYFYPTLIDPKAKTFSFEDMGETGFLYMTRYQI